MKKCLLLFIIIVLSISNMAFAQDEAGKLNINAVTQEQLVKEVGLDAGLAKMIIEHRNQNGEYVDMDELLDLKGIDAALLRKLKDKLYVKPAANCNC